MIAAMTFFVVMRGLDPRIHSSLLEPLLNVDPRIKPAGDAESVAAPTVTTQRIDEFSSCPRLSRASRSSQHRSKNDVDGLVKPGQARP